MEILLDQYHILLLVVGFLVGCCVGFIEARNVYGKRSREREEQLRREFEERG